MAERFNLTAQLQLQAPTNTGAVITQIRRQLKGLTVDVQVKSNVQAIAKTNKALQNVDRSARSSAKSVGQLNRNLSDAARRFSVITVATGTMLGLARAFKNSVGEAIAFERELVRISQVTGKSTKNLQGLTKEVTRLSTSLGASSKDLLNVSRVLAQAGFNAEKTRKALDILAKTSLGATFNSIQDTTEGAIAVLRQFRKEARAAGGEIKFLEQTLDAINAVSKNFAVESGDLITVIRRVGGVFEAAGGKVNELIALFTSVRATTRESAETIATGLRTIFTRLQRTDTIDQLKNLGIVLQDSQGQFVGAFEAVNRLSRGLSALDPRDFRFSAIVEQLGGFRQIGKVIPLIRQFTTAQDALNVAQGASGSVTRDAATAQQALAVQIAKVREDFDALIRKFADSSTFRSLSTGALEVAKAFIRIADALEPILPLITSLMALKIGKSLAPGLASIAGIGGGARGRAMGGRIHGFARGGFVPGTGNRDTVPAMLQPGEFVIRKSSVAKLGASTLEAMNNNRFENGGRFSGLGTQRKREQKGDLRKELSQLQKTKALGEDDKLIKSQIGKLQRGALAAADAETYAGAFLRPEARGETFSGETNKTELGKMLRGIKGYSRVQNDPSVQGIIQKYLDKNTYTLKAGSLSSAASGDLEDTLLDGIVNTIKSGAGKISSTLGIKGTPDTAKALKSANIDQTMGNIFESVLNFAGAPYGKESDAPNAPFDYGKGLQKIAGHFGLPPGAKADAKTFFTEGNLQSFIKKVANENLKEAEQELRPIITQLAAAKGDVSLPAARELLGLGSKATAEDIGNAAKDHKLSFSKAGTGKYKFAKAAMGGKIDSVPALLTPGEFVVKKSAAQSIGYGNLNKMNQTGVQRFNSGGPVQKFADGGITVGSSSMTTHFSSEGVNKKDTALIKAANQKYSNEMLALVKNLKNRGRTDDEVIDSLKQFSRSIAKGDTAQKALTNAQNKTADQMAAGATRIDKKGKRQETAGVSEAGLAREGKGLMGTKQLASLKTFTKSTKDLELAQRRFAMEIRKGATKEQALQTAISRLALSHKRSDELSGKGRKAIAELNKSRMGLSNAYRRAKGNLKTAFMGGGGAVGGAGGAAGAGRAGGGLGLQKLDQMAGAAQSFVFLGSMVSGLATQFSGMSEATKKATTETLGFATSMIGIGGTLVQTFTAMALSGGREATASASAAAADNLEAGASKKAAASGGGGGGAVGVGLAIAGAVLATISVMKFFAAKYKAQADEIAQTTDKQLQKIKEGGGGSVAAIQDNVRKEVDLRNKSKAVSDAMWSAGLSAAAAGATTAVSMAAAGAAMGSVVPVVGTVVGALVGLGVGYLVYGNNLDQVRKKTEEQISALDKSVKGLVELYQSTHRFRQAIDDIDASGVSDKEKTSRRVDAQFERGLGLMGGGAGYNLKAETSVQAKEAQSELNMLALGVKGKSGNELTKEDFAGREDEALLQKRLEVAQKKLASSTEEAGKDVSVARKTLSMAGTEAMKEGKGFDELLNDPSGATTQYAMALKQAQHAIDADATIRRNTAKEIRDNADIAMASLDSNSDEYKVQLAKRSAAENQMVQIEQRRAQMQKDLTDVERQRFADADKLRAMDERALKAQQALLEATLRTAGVMNRLVDMERAADMFETSVNNMAASANDSAMTFRVFSPAGLNDLTQVGNQATFAGDVDRITAGQGADVQREGAIVKTTARMLAESESKRTVRTGLDTEMGEEQAKKMLGEMVQGLEDFVGPEIFDKMADKLSTAAKNGTIDEKEWDEIFAPMQQMGEQSAEALKKLIAVQNKIIGTYIKQATNLQAVFDKELKLRDQVIENEAKGAALRAQARGKSISVEQKQRVRQARAQTALTGVRGAAGSGKQVQAGDVGGLKAARDAAKQRQADIRRRLDSEKVDAKTAKRLGEEQAKLINIIKKTGAELDRLADQSDRAADIMGQIDAERAKREAVTGLVTDFVVGGAEDRNKMMQTAGGLQTSIATGTLQGQDAEQRSAIVGLLDRLKDVQIAGTGGLTGKEVKQELVFRDAIRMGLDPQIAKTLATATSKEEQLINALDRLTQQMANAARANVGQPFATGGIVQYRGGGGTIFKPRGTDTVPAMLTPGEFVIRKSAVDQIGVGNLQALNKSGGGVVYRQGGGAVHAINNQIGVGDVGIMSGQQYKATFVEALRAIGRKRFLSLINQAAPDAQKQKGSQKKFTNAQQLAKLMDAGQFDPTKLKAPDAVARVLDSMRDNSEIFQKVDASHVAIRHPSIPMPLNHHSNSPAAANYVKAIRGYTQMLTQAFGGAGGQLDGPDLSQAVITQAGGPKILQRIRLAQDGAGKIIAWYTHLANMIAGDKTGGFIRDIPNLPKWLVTMRGGATDVLGGATDEQRGAAGLKKRGKMSRKEKALFGAMQQLMRAGAVQGGLRMAQGGAVPGEDSIPAMLTPGEFVMNPQAVRKHGVGFMKHLNQGRIPGFRRGGLVATGNVQYRAGGSNGAEASGSAMLGGVISLDPTRVQGILNAFNSQFAANFAGISETFSKFNENITNLLNGIQSMTWTHWHQGEMTLALNIANSEALGTMLGEAIQGKMVTLIDEKIEEYHKNLNKKPG